MEQIIKLPGVEVPLAQKGKQVVIWIPCFIIQIDIVEDGQISANHASGSRVGLLLAARKQVVRRNPQLFAHFIFL